MKQFEILQTTYTKMRNEELSDMLLRQGFDQYKIINIELKSKILIQYDTRPTLQIYILFTQEI